MKTLYATILGLTLVSGSAFAAVTSTITDDDAAIMNLGKSVPEMNCPMHKQTHAATTEVIDDDESIAKTGLTGGHVAHGSDIEADLFLDNDLSL